MKKEIVKKRDFTIQKGTLKERMYELAKQSIFVAIIQQKDVFK